MKVCATFVLPYSYKVILTWVLSCVSTETSVKLLNSLFAALTALTTSRLFFLVKLKFNPRFFIWDFTERKAIKQP